MHSRPCCSMGSRSLNSRHLRPAIKVKSASSDILQQRAIQYYEQVWSHGRVTLLDSIMSEDHEQHDVIWQPGRVGAGRRVMKRGVLAYRMAYPDLKFTVLQASSCCSAGGSVADDASAGTSGSDAEVPGSDSSQARGASSTPGTGLQGAWVFVRWHATGTNLGPVREQAPTGRPVSFAGVTHLEFDEEGRIRRSFVFRQAPEDEKRYFLAAEEQQQLKPKIEPATDLEGL